METQTMETQTMETQTMETQTMETQTMETQTIIALNNYNGKYGLVDKYTGKMVVDYKYNCIYNYMNLDSCPFKIVGGANKWGIINNKGDIIVPEEYNYIKSIDINFAILTLKLETNKYRSTVFYLKDCYYMNDIINYSIITHVHINGKLYIIGINNDESQTDNNSYYYSNIDGVFMSINGKKYARIIQLDENGFGIVTTKYGYYTMIQINTKDNHVIEIESIKNKYFHNIYRLKQIGEKQGFSNIYECSWNNSSNKIFFEANTGICYEAKERPNFL